MKLNTSGTYISERMARTILTKVLLKKDPGFVDMMNPCGAGRTVMSYAPDGGCFPTDEARMLGDNIFKLGNIKDENYDKMLNNENLLFLLSAGCSDLWNYRSVFSPWLGIDPVVNYAVEKNVIPKGSSRLQQVLKHQFKTVFSYLLGDNKYAEVFQRWTQDMKEFLMKKKIKSKVIKKKVPLTKSLGDLMKDEDGFVSKETILKVGLSTVAALGIAGALTDISSGQVSHNNVITPQSPTSNCASHTNITTHTSY